MLLSQTMQYYINKRSDLSDKIATAERPLKDEEKAFEILCGLPEEYDPLIMGLVRSKLLTFSLLT